MWALWWSFSSRAYNTQGATILSKATMAGANFVQSRELFLVCTFAYVIISCLHLILFGLIHVPRLLANLGTFSLKKWLFVNNDLTTWKKEQSLLDKVVRALWLHDHKIRLNPIKLDSLLFDICTRQKRVYQITFWYFLRPMQLRYFRLASQSNSSSFQNNSILKYIFSVLFSSNMLSSFLSL